MTAQAASCDVLICGGGMVGASLACALSTLPLRVAMVEAVPFGSTSQPSFDDRTIALSRTSQRILQTVGVWPVVASDSCPIRAIHVSERGRLGSAVISAAGQGVGELGYVVANRAIGEALWDRLAQADNVAVYSPAVATMARVHPDHVEVMTRSGDAQTAINARLLVVADGARSGLRQLLGIAATERDYGQTAVVGNVAVSGTTDPFTAYERFTPDGPVALLPFREGGRAFVMASPHEAARQAMALGEEAFLDLLQSAFGQRLGRFTRLGRRAAYPLSLVQAQRLTVPRSVVIGNAAHGLHPVAGQGYNLGLRDVAALAELIAQAVRAEADPGKPSVLQSYVGWRRNDQRNVVTFTDGLIRLFELPLAGTGRGLGLMVFDMLPGAKRALARQTMGMAGRMSRLARGLAL